MLQNLPLNKFELIEDAFHFNEDSIKNYNEESNEGYFLEIDVQYSEKLYELRNDLPFLAERMKLEKVGKLVANLHEKNGNVIHIRKLKQALNHDLILKKFHRVIKFDQNAWLKPYIDMNTKLRQKAKNNFEKDFFKLISDAVFGKTMENVGKHRNIKLVTTERRRNYLVSETNCHTAKFFTENLLTTEMRKTHILMNKSVYLGLLTLYLSKSIMCEFWYVYVNRKW